MKQVFLITQKDLDLASHLQHKLLSVTDDSGILFVGIRVQAPCELQPRPVFIITIGCENYPQAVEAYAKYLLKDDVISENQLQISAFKGKVK